MVATFVRAELHSQRFGAAVRAAMRRHRVTRRVVEQPDTADARQSAQRLAVLREYPRYGLDCLLFVGFPYDVVWSWVALMRDEQRAPADEAAPDGLVRVRGEPDASPTRSRCRQGKSIASAPLGIAPPANRTAGHGSSSARRTSTSMAGPVPA